jgi:hypothetical protein
VYDGAALDGFSVSAVHAAPRARDAEHAKTAVAADQSVRQTVRSTRWLQRTAIAAPPELSSRPRSTPDMPRRTPAFAWAVTSGSPACDGRCVSLTPEESSEASIMFWSRSASAG